MTPRKGQCYVRADGTEIRVERVANGQVCFVLWSPKKSYVLYSCVSISDFATAIRNESVLFEESAPGFVFPLKGTPT